MAKIIVEDFLRLSRLEELDTESGRVGSPTSPPPDRKAAKGVFTELGGIPVAFYADKGALHLRAGDGVVELSGAKAELTGDDVRTLRIVRGEDELLRLSYPNPIQPPLELDPTAAEAEDFDLGLFVHNVLASEARRRFLLGKWS